ncbi:threonine ammonia-lyase, biosynthetic [uncultured Abyssibacter sp.]|uniref:threonine ammonia-lyase, biosynthetic n=1 Tax=uncultured Abyssibacter sp. TaxID=2320202 RepID=UPI0032B24E36
MNDAADTAAWPAVDLKLLAQAVDAATVYDVARVSPLEAAAKLTERLGNNIWLKREDAQQVHSFKLRGAYNRIAKLTPQQRAAGVVAASAGNHAQGVALAGQALDIRTAIVMPETTPSIKVDAVRAYGAEVVLTGDAYDDALAHANELVAQRGQTFIHPYDDPDVMAGQGTVAREILDQHAGTIDTVYVPVGGGGLIGGMAAYIKQRRPEIEVVAVEPLDSACLHRALEAGERVVLDQVGLFADGVAVRQIGAYPFAVARQCVDRTVQVSVDEICAAIRAVFEETRSVPEPAGALALAGLERDVQSRDLRDRSLVAVISGANINFDRLRYVSERTALGAHREALLAVTLPEVPGSFLTFCEHLGRRAVTEFNYRYADSANAHIFIGVAIRDGDRERDALCDEFRAAGYQVNDLSDNDVAKEHLRHLVGGRADALRDERLFRFEFPERPGALMRFLQQLGGRWNISLFHYRNHGAAFGRVLAGIQVPDDDMPDFLDRLRGIGYRYWDESDNPAYRLFLR